MCTMFRNLRVLLFLSGLMFFTPVSVQAGSAQVLILHSYSQEYPWTRNQHSGFVDELRASFVGDVLFSTEYLDTKRKALDSVFVNGFRDYMAVKYQGYLPDIIYVTDDNALLFARQVLVELFPGVPVIFSGVNDYSVREWIDPKRITGVFEKKEIVPNLKVVAAAADRGQKICIVGDGSNTDMAIRREIKEELEAFPDLEPEYIAESDINVLTGKLAESRSGIVFLTTIGGIKDKTGSNLTLEEIIRRIVISGDFTLFSMEDAYLYQGVLGGYVTSGSRQGSEAARMAASYMAGMPISEIKPLLDSPNEFVFDAPELERKQISLPRDVRSQAKILNPAPTFYQSNKTLILGSIFILVVLLALVLVVDVMLMSRKNREVNKYARDLRDQHEELMRTQESLVDAQRIAGMGSWSLDLNSNHLEWSNEIFHIFEIDRQHFQASYEAFLEAIHPEDRDLVNQTYLNSVESKTEYELQHRLQMKDGRIKYVLERGKTYYDSEGQPERSVGTIQDVTERVLAEQRLRQWAKVFENTIEGVIITDEQLRIIDINRAFTEITGFSREEVIGEKPNMRRSERHDNAFYQQMWQSIEDTGSWSGEIWNRKKNGELSPEWLSITTLQDDSGRVINYMGVFTDISVLKRSEEKLEHLANHDPLTGLPNRTLLYDRLDRAIRVAQRNSANITVLFLDLDRFKIINDTLGHAIGDQLLIEAAARLSAVLRDADTVGRLGGDEFLAIMEGCGDIAEVEVVSDRLRQTIAKPFVIEEKELFIGVSIGISVFPQDGDTAATLIRNADSAMYQAKKSGRNSIEFYDMALTERAAKRMEFDAALRRAIEREEFLLYYQPKVDLKSGAITSAEVLIRWLRDGVEMIRPDYFIPVAEESGLILPIGEWVLRESVRQMSAWKQSNTPLKHLAVNLSALQIQHGDIPRLVTELLEEYQLEAEYLEMEITESVLFDHPEQAGVSLNELRDIGVSLAMDDFGTGFSSLINLKQYPIDTIKIDRSFVGDILIDPNDEAITRAVLAMGQSLGLTVVAEGVEKTAQAEYLDENGCDYAQGYLYSPPVPADEFEKLLLNDKREH